MDKNTKIAFFLIALVVILMPYFSGTDDNYIPVAKEAKTENVDKEVVSNTSTETVSTIDTKKDISYLSSPTDEIKMEKDNVLKDSTSIEKKSNSIQFEEKLITVETDLYKAKFSTKNAVLKSWKLKKYNFIESDENIELIKENSDPLFTKIKLQNGSFFPEMIAGVNVEKISFSSNDTDSKSLIFSFKDGKGNVLLTKEYVFYNDKYSFDVEIDQTNIFDKISDSGMTVEWKDGLNYTEISKDGKNFNREDYYSEVYYKQLDMDLEHYGKDEEKIEIADNLDWGATRTKYFEAIISTPIKSSPFFIAKKVEFTKTFDKFIKFPSLTKDIEQHTDLGFAMNYKKTSPKNYFTVFIGPMDNELLATYEKEFENTLNWGWSIVSPFSHAVLWMMKFLHKYISNYGVIILILALIINTLLLPFNIKSYKSTMAMKALAPEIKKMKEKFGGDMQRQQQETMALYKKHGVNPMGSCLPNLLPMPVLYSMFIVFGATIELRGEGFMLWLTDLSLPEVMFSLPFDIPLYGGAVGILPILMGVTMFFQMKDSMGADPNQKMMAYMMPVLMVVMFNNFSSGLILYYTLGNIYRLVQQKIIKSK